MLATGVGGPLTGHGVDVLIVDDPVKNRAEAESAVHREKAWDWFNDVAFTRLEPNASWIVNMARWHQDDLAGRLIAQGWEYLRIPAECDDENDPLGRPMGAALWPDRHDAQRLAAIKKQVGPYTWASLYQGVPRPKGSEVFRGVVYGPRPESYRIAIGLDFAYSTKSKSDYSVATVLMQGKKDKAYHVPLVYRVQVEAPVFGEMLAGLKGMYPGAKWYAYIAGPEKGTVDFLNRTFNLKIVTLPCEGDKFNRAQPVAAAWNAGVITVPTAKGPDGQEAPPEWVDDFVTELCDFTGAQDPHDDQVDALAGAYTGLNKFSGWWSEL
jgi:predicted phage terminase large subunit-like protein